MSTLDEAAEFFGSFFEAEFKVLEANLDGAASFSKLRAKMQAMLAKPAVFEIEHMDVSKLKGMAKLAIENTKKEIAPRQLFLVEQHNIGKRKLYRGYAGQPERPKHFTAYAMTFWADDALQMIATYLVCSTCRGLGKPSGSKCSDCGGSGGQRKTGEKIKSGNPSAVKKLVRPIDPISAEHYDRP